MFRRLIPALLAISGVFAGALAQAQERGFGWQPVPEAVAALDAQTEPLFRAQVASLAAGSDDRDALIYRFLAIELGVDRILAFNQLDAGTCVGAGTCQSLGVSLAVQIHTRRDGPVQWVAPFSVEAVYALGRQHAGRLGAWDGSSGAWSCAAIRDLGTCVMEKIGSIDLSRYDPRRAQQWARVGVPRDIVAAAEPRKVLACTLVRSPDAARALLQNGYALITCSNESYIKRRDQMGFCRNDGRDAWPHCMAIVAYRGAASGRVGYLVLNSWGDYCDGPCWPADQPLGSFWINDADLRQHLAARDTWAIGDITGFSARRLTIPEAVDVGGLGEVDLKSILRPRIPSNRSSDDAILALSP